MKKSQGFTLIEMVIAISLVVLIITAMLSGFGPWIKFKQRLDTEQRLKDLTQATSALYRAHAFSIDDNIATTTLAPLGAADGALVLTPTLRIQSDCPVGVGVDPSDTTSALANLAPLQPYLAKPLADVVSDGFNNTICVLVSPRQFKDHGGVRLFYHTVAYVSIGDNTILDPETGLVDNGSGFSLVLSGDDTGMSINGFSIALENYKTTANRLRNLVKAYETYFTVRFFIKSDRDLSINYFYANDGTNNGDPGDIDPARDLGPTIPSTRAALGGVWDITSFDNVRDAVNNVSIGIALGIGDRDSIDAWGNPILVDNRSERVKAGVNESGTIKKQPPFTALFGALLPGTNTECSDSAPSNPGSLCPTFMTATAVGKYSN